MAKATKKSKPDDGKPRKGLVARAKTMLLAVLLGVLALIGGLVGAMGPSGALSLLASGPAEESAEPSHGGGDALAGHGAQPTAEGGLMVAPFHEIIVNITSTTASGRQTSRFLKVSLAIVYDSAAPGAHNIESRSLYLRDTIQEFLRLLSENELQGSAGIAMLKSELLRRVQVITESDAPRDILIADLIIQ